jgi:hypothetical protein
VAIAVGDGAFTLRSVPAGTYELRASGSQDIGTESRVATGVVSLTTTGEDADNIVVALRPSVTVTGRIEFDSDARPQPSEILLVSQPVGVNLPSAPGQSINPAAVKPDWSFELRNLAGPVVIRNLSRNPASRWRLSRVSLDGVDITDTRLDASKFEGATLEVVLTDRASALRGRAVSGRGESVRDYRVIVFSEDSAKWPYPSRFLFLGTPDQNGDFEVKRLPPDHYLVIALGRVETDWQDPEILELLRQDATRVLLSEGEPANVELRLHEWPRRR